MVDTTSSEEPTTSPIPEVYSTGNAEFNLVLHGGIPAGSLTLLIGQPGTGKTVVGLQMAWAAARAGKRVIYLTNVSESHAHLISHVRPMAFFDESVLRHTLNLVSINTSIQSQGVEATMNFILDVVRDAQADFLIVDSYLGLKQLFATDNRVRETFFNLTSRLSLQAVTTVLVGEYPAHAIQTEPEFAVADNIIELTYVLHGVQRQRSVAVLKMRGSSFLEGLHTLHLSSAGVQVFPRQEALMPIISQVATTQRVSSGLAALDSMLYGGLWAGSTTLLVGASGTGKTLLGLHFLAVIAPNHTNLLISFCDSADQIKQQMQHFGLCSANSFASCIEVLHVSPIELQLDVVAMHIRQLIASRNIGRIMIDSIDELERVAHEQQRHTSFLIALMSMFQQHGITTLLTRERMGAIQSEATIAKPDLLYAVDTILLMDYCEREAHFSRTLTTLKHRGSEHDHSRHQVQIQAHCLSILDASNNRADLVVGQQAEPNQDG